MTVQVLEIKSVKELCNMTLVALQNYKANVVRAKLSASTDFELEAYVNQLERVNTAINEKKLATYLEFQEKRFKDVLQDIEESVTYAKTLTASSFCENQTSQDINTGTSSKLAVATAECLKIQERQ